MRFKLLTQHYAHDRLLEEGTVVGDGTPYAFFGVSQFMEPLDDEARAAIAFRYGGKSPHTGEGALFPGELKPPAEPVNESEGADPTANLSINKPGGIKLGTSGKSSPLGL